MPCSNSVQGSNKGQANTASTSPQEDKKGTRNKAENHGAIRTRPLFPMPFTRDKSTDMLSEKIKTKQLAPLFCKRSTPGFTSQISSSPRHRCSTTSSQVQPTTTPGVCFLHVESSPATSLRSLPLRRTLGPDCSCSGNSSAALESAGEYGFFMSMCKPPRVHFT